VSTLDFYMQMADAELVPRTHPGLVDPRVAALRAFRRYSNSATMDITDPWGQLHWIGTKQGRVFGIVHRLSTSGQKMTMTDIAKEAQCSTSTVSRAVLRFQAWRMFAIDVVRGRHGGISVRLRHVGDELSHYARAAWERLRSVAIRARINVASLINGDRGPEPDTEVRTPVTRSSYMDATFNEAWANAEARGAEIRAEAARVEREIAPLGRARAFDPGRLTAENVIAERRWLDANDPDWWLIAEEARERLIK
jgi:hypothetical protein